jgi:hypothetical protein
LGFQIYIYSGVYFTNFEKQKTATMIRKSIVSYYTFGTQMRYLQDAQKGMNIKEKDCILDNIDRFLNNIGALELVVTSRAAGKLRDCRQTLGVAENSVLDEKQARELRDIMNDIRLTLDAEIQGIHAFTTTPKRLDTGKLLDDVESLFAPDTYSYFPDIARYDFAEAGRCAAFELPTSAAFHILRATEANLRHYYKQMVKQKRIASEMWGPIVQDLKKRNKTKKHITLNNHLDNIRLSFRNPTQHPEAMYDIHEVQDLFSLCIDTNNRMFKIVREEG